VVSILVSDRRRPLGKLADLQRPHVPNWSPPPKKKPVMPAAVLARHRPTRTGPPGRRRCRTARRTCRSAARSPRRRTAGTARSSTARWPPSCCCSGPAPPPGYSSPFRGGSAEVQARGLPLTGGQRDPRFPYEHPSRACVKTPKVGHTGTWPVVLTAGPRPQSRPTDSVPWVSLHRCEPNRSSLLMELLP
jgi:hypothetical protein